MDVQAAPPTFAASNTGQPPAGNPPVLGQQVPGRSGGLPAQGGLSVLANPMARELQSYGRGEDTMLVHMTPNEVNSLQGLAMAHGGSLTINPHTGLPEAGWLGKLLPTILGGVLAATGVGAPLAAGIVGLGQTALTGDLKKGLMAGLGAFGGASLAGAAGLGGEISKNAFGVLSDKAGIFGANMGLGATATSAAPGAVTGAAATGAPVPPAPVPPAPVPPTPVATPPIAGAPVPPPIDASLAGSPAFAAEQAAQQAAAQTAAQTAPQFTGNFFSKFGQAARQGLPGGMISKAAPMAAGLGILSSVSEAMTPSGGFTTSKGQIDNAYQGPYTAQRRKPVFAGTTEDILAGEGGQQQYFDVDVPEIYNVRGQVVQPGSQTKPGTMIYQNVLNPNAKKGQPRYTSVGTPYMGLYDEGYAKGGEVELADGAFVVDARTVSELGNGSSNAGIEALMRMGGRPVRGPGDGVSDSVPARIGRDQPARVARDEVVFPPEAVRRVGKGSEKRGAQKLYALMEKAHKARRKSKRGKDTKLRKGLA